MNELQVNVYFNDVERSEELIELIKKTDGFDSYALMSSINRNIVEKKDRFVINITLQIENIDAIKLLFKILKDNQLEICKLQGYIGDNELIDINLENEESIKQTIDLFQSNKSIQTRELHENQS